MSTEQKQPLRGYCVTYEFNGRHYWENIRSRKPERITRRFKKVKVVSVELLPDGYYKPGHGTND